MSAKAKVSDLRAKLAGRPIELVEYAGGVTLKSLFRCLDESCGHSWHATTDNVIRGRRGCPECANRAQLVDVDEAAYGVTRVSKVVGKKKPSTFRCLAEGCSHEWVTTFENIERGGKCPACFARKREGEIAEMRAALLKRDIELLECTHKSDKKSRFRCLKDGHEWTTVIYDVMQGQGCRVCAGLARVTAEDVVRRLEGRDIELLEYGGTTAAMSRFRCKIDGHEWSTTATSVLSNGQGCAKCAGNIAFTFEQVEAEALTLGLQLIEYGGSVNKKSRFRCVEHGDEIYAPLSGARAGKVCPTCSLVNRWDTESASKALLDDMVECVEYVANSAGKSTFRCLKPECGHEWKTSAGAVMAGSRCPKCAGTMPKTEAEIRVEVEQSDRPIKLITYGGGIDRKSSWGCDKCGHEWSATFYNVVRSGTGCPACAVYGFNSTKPADFYVYMINTDAGQYLGFGITNKIKTRHCHHTRSADVANANLTLLHSTRLPGHIARSIETRLMQYFPMVDSGVKGFKRESMHWSDAEYEKLVHVLKEAERLFPVKI